MVSAAELAALVTIWRRRRVGVAAAFVRDGLIVARDGGALDPHAQVVWLLLRAIGMVDTEEVGGHQSAVHGMVTANSASAGMPPMDVYPAAAVCARRLPVVATVAAWVSQYRNG